MTDHFLEMKQGDRLPAFETTLAADSAPPDLTSAVAVTLHIRMDERPEDEDLKVDGPMVVVGDPTEGKVRYDWAEDDTDRAGGLMWEVQVDYPNGVTATFPNGVDGYPGVIRPQLG